MLPKADPRTLRLYDMGPHGILTVQCSCGRIARFADGELQWRRGLPSDTLLRPAIPPALHHVPAHQGLRILLWDADPMMSHSPHDIGAHLVIVEGAVPQRVRV